MHRFHFEWLTLTSRLFRVIKHNNLLLWGFSCAYPNDSILLKCTCGLHFNWLANSYNFGRLWPNDFKNKKWNSHWQSSEHFIKIQGLQRNAIKFFSNANQISMQNAYCFPMQWIQLTNVIGRFERKKTMVKQRWTWTRSQLNGCIILRSWIWMIIPKYVMLVAWDVLTILAICEWKREQMWL